MVPLSVISVNKKIDGNGFRGWRKLRRSPFTEARLSTTTWFRRGNELAVDLGTFSDLGSPQLARRDSPIHICLQVDEQRKQRPDAGNAVVPTDPL
jgi:hypothetical protein